ncbi:MAG: hypothetical protein ACXVW6_01650 [Nocardioidaceae bacterium]
MPQDPLPTVADALYALPPGEFTPARDAEAKAVRADGDRELAEAIKRLRKPAAAAWVVNMLMRHRYDEMVQVLDLGASLRQAQSDLDGDALRELTRQRRRLIGAVAGDGRALARDLGVKVSESVVRQVEQTLHAAMVDTDAAAAVRTGLLVEPLAPAGMGSLKVADAADHTALGALAAGTRPARPAGPGGTGGRGRLLSVVPERTEEPAAPEEDTSAADAEARRAEELARKQAAADEELAEAEEALDKARRRWRKADRRVGRLEARGLQLVAEAEELRRRLAEVEHAGEAVEEDTSEAEERRESARTRLDAAEAALAEARERRAALDG